MDALRLKKLLDLLGRNLVCRALNTRLRSEVMYLTDKGFTGLLPKTETETLEFFLFLIGNIFLLFIKGKYKIPHYMRK